MANKESFTVKQVELALRQSGAIYTHAAQLLIKATGKSCSPNTVKNMIKRYKHLAKVEKEINQATLDLAESKLITKINEGHLTAVIFYLKTKGKARGYIERAEITGRDGEDFVPAVLRVPPKAQTEEEWAGQHKPAA